MALKKIAVIGNVGPKGAAVREVGEGDKKSHVLSFSVAADTGYGDKATTDWFDVTLWVFGDKGVERAKKLCELVVKGAQVAVAGDFSTTTSGDKRYLKIKLGGFDDLQIVKFAAKKEDAKTESTEDESDDSEDTESPDLPF